MVDETGYLPYLYQEELYDVKPNILVALNKPWESVGSDEVVLLQKILQSVKRTLAGVQVITQPSFRWEDIAHFHPLHVVAFGAEMEGVNTQYEVVETNGISVIQADTLDALDDQKKKALWRALQQMFDLKA